VPVCSPVCLPVLVCRASQAMHPECYYFARPGKGKLLRTHTYHLVYSARRLLPARPEAARRIIPHMAGGGNSLEARRSLRCRWYDKSRCLSAFLAHLLVAAAARQLRAARAIPEVWPAVDPT
jgi:hypothetical protein